MRGYTLMELMVTVALLALMSAMTAVGLQPLQARFRLRRATDATAQFLVRARQRAMETGRCFQVEVLADGLPVRDGASGDALRMSRRRDANCEGVASPLAFVEVESLTLPEHLRVRQESRGTLVFRPTGRSGDGAEGRLIVGEDDAPRIVVAAPNGPVCTLEDAKESCP